MAVDTFIPEVWSSVLQVELERRHVFAQDGLVNRDHEGEISNAGDTVRVNTVGDITVVDYERNVTTLDPETLATTDATMVIDQAKAFSFELDDLDAAQVQNSGELMSKAMLNSALALRAQTDALVSGKMVAGAGSVLTAATLSDADGAYTTLIALAEALDDNDVPEEGRWVVIPPAFRSLLRADNRFIDASAYGSNAPIMNGEIGRALGFNVIVSNTLPAGATTGKFVIAGHQIATSFAEQINKVEAFRPHGSFSDAVKGLHLYGAQVFRPEALAVIDATI